MHSVNNDPMEGFAELNHWTSRSIMILVSLGSLCLSRDTSTEPNLSLNTDYYKVSISKLAICILFRFEIKKTLAYCMFFTAPRDALLANSNSGVVICDMSCCLRELNATFTYFMDKLKNKLIRWPTYWADNPVCSVTYIGHRWSTLDNGGKCVGVDSFVYY